MKLDESARALIGKGANATLVTLNPDGSPQVSVIWVALQAGEHDDELVIAHLSDSYRKVRNIRRDGRVALTVVADPDGPTLREYLWVSGTARIVEGGAPALLRQLSDVLTPGSGFPPADAPEGFLTRITVEKVGGVGPWAQ